ncbi:MAG: 50S ribosomal protein L3 N(5)-glutamine methyltransferase [Halioglobus sp.]|nr:50S ribosomal protein L3 N(5)-glutamine methyltransferase [Halioglobus sp.]|tara:strand:- start:435 stop:1355 length:921 start_codon:yes stop_codon:yes gene_type:complete
MDVSNGKQGAPATLGAALQYCNDALAAAGLHFGHGTDNAWDEAVQLVLHALRLPAHSDDTVLSLPLDGAGWQRVQALLRRRIEERVPLPYLLGRAWFAGLELRCDARAIVPRSPIGELIVNEFQPWYGGPAPARVLDLCCGGGAIGLATAHYHPQARVDLVDLDDDALALARENAQLLGVSGRVEIQQSDLFSALGGRRYDLVLCNPPYVNAGDLAAMPAEFYAEPELSLGSGEDGLDLTRRILAAAGDHLEPHGLLILEVGHSWPALELAYPRVPFTWIEFEHGGAGVFAMSAGEWQEYSASWRR